MSACNTSSGQLASEESWHNIARGFESSLVECVGGGGNRICLLCFDFRFGFGSCAS